MACAPITVGSAHLAGTTVYDLAFWTFTLWLVIRAVVLDRPRSWLAAGAVAGIGLENKDLLDRPYYTAGFLPLVFAAGSVRIAGCDPMRVRRILWLAAPVVGLALTVAFILPVLPLSTFARIPSLHKFDYDLGETFGWPQLTTKVAQAYDALRSTQRKSASIFTSNYGEAGAVALYGPSDGLPYPLSGHNIFWLWGPGRADDRTVIAVGSVDQLRTHFARCDYDSAFRSPDDVNNDENGTQIWTCRYPDSPWSGLWGRLRHYN